MANLSFLGHFGHRFTSLYLRGTKSEEPNTRPPGCATPQQPTLHFVINKQNFDGKQGMKQHHDELGSHFAD